LSNVNQFGDPDIESTKLLREREEEGELAELRNEVTQIRQLIEDLTREIDCLVEGQHAENPVWQVVRTPEVVTNLSFTGVGFISTDHLGSGDYLRLNLRLKTSPQTIIDCIGVIVRNQEVESSGCHGHETRYDFGVRFMHTHETDRERLIHYLFKVQRRMLRDRREQKDALVDESVSAA
jgi:hypothetical protein